MCSRRTGKVPRVSASAFRLLGNLMDRDSALVSEPQMLETDSYRSFLLSQREMSLFGFTPF